MLTNIRKKAPDDYIWEGFVIRKINPVSENPMAENIQSAQLAADTLVIMISVGDRAFLSNSSFPRLSQWASSHGYSVVLVKKNLVDDGKAPHFNKLIVHRTFPGYKRYIIVDDDILIKKDAPAIEDVPSGYVGLCLEGVQDNTNAKHVLWTGNTGFIVVDSESVHLLEQAYEAGVYPYNAWDGSGLGIWGPQDQATLNNILFLNNKAYQLNWKWNYQPVIDYFENGRGWQYWIKHRWYRVLLYVRLFLRMPFAYERKFKQAYAIHMVRGVYPRFFDRITK